MHQHLELATGHELRPSSPDDAPRLVAMFERCSPASRVTALVATTLAESRHVYRMFDRLGPTTIACSGTTCALRVDLSPE